MAENDELMAQAPVAKLANLSFPFPFHRVVVSGKVGAQLGT